MTTQASPCCSTPNTASLRRPSDSGNCPPDENSSCPQAPAAGSWRLRRRRIRPASTGLCKRSRMDVASVARRARTENFPVASLLFPRRLRPHLRAVYGFARLVDILGDELEGDRLAVLDELERELDACYSG